jgi:signal transduction histidine kinase/CheY-like chemotaxis protein
VNFDIRTLSILTAVSSLVFAFASFMVAHLVQRERYLQDWTWGSGLAALSTLLVGLRGIAPDWVSAALANTALVAAFTLMYMGTRGTVGLPLPRPAVWLYTVCAGLGLAWFTVVDPQLFARILIVSLALIPLNGMIAVAFWRYDQGLGPTPLRVANRITVVVYLLGVLLFVARLYPAMQAASSTSYLSSTSLLLVAPYFWAILFNVWMSIMITLTVSARLQAALIDARDQAQANSVAKSQFLANMSHEIRTPMNAVLGMLTLLQSTDLSVRQRDYADKTENAARSLLGLLNDILDFSKVEAGKMSLDPQPFRLAHLVRDLSAILGASLGGKPIELAFELDPAVPPVLLADGLRLQQVLLNLGGNAVKFTAQGRVVVAIRLLELHARAARVAFSVQDSGIGIAPENRERIFSGFSQAEASTTRRFGGTGLGLAISQRLVGLMGGTLELDSQLGKGSTFHFMLELPLVAAADAAPPEAEPLAQPHRRLQGMRLLVVEDNPINQQVAQELLQSQGAQVTLAANGQLGVDAVTSAQPPFDAVLMDLQMPVLDGYGATRLIRERWGAQELPIIAMTANAMPSDREACLAAGMNDHVGKPFALADVVERLLRHRPGFTPGHPAPAGPASAQTGTPAVGLPALLDVDTALHRMGGMHALYVRAARVACTELTELLQASDAPEPGDALTRRLHALKGSAGMLGANQLATIAARLEQDCRHEPSAGVSAQGWRELLATAAATRQALQQAIATLDDAADSERTLATGGTAQEHDLQTALRSLMDVLLACDLQALQQFTEIRPALVAQGVQELGALEAAVQGLQFDVAHALCQAIARRHAARSESAA